MRTIILSICLVILKSLGYEATHFPKTHYVEISDDVDGKLLAHKDAADMIIALQADVLRLQTELYYCQKGLD